MAGAQLSCPKCQTRLKLPDATTLTGKVIRCPKCGAAFRPGEPAPEVQAPKRREKPTDETYREEPPAQEKRPASRKAVPPPGKSKPAGSSPALPLLLGGGVLVLFCLCGGVSTLAFWWLRAERGPEPVAVTPPPVEQPVPPPQPPPANGDLAPDVLVRVKAATAYVRVTFPDDRTGTGSGFFALGPGLVLTNAHVVGMLRDGSPPPRRIEVILESGERGERALAGRIVTVDRSSDLAVLRVEGAGLPEPLAVMPGAGLRETQRVFVFGFPFGEALGKNITVSTSSVSSLRKEADGYLSQIQVNGGMHPGNSGGPVVDERGNVVGVAVAVIRNTQINFAVPGERVHSVLNGRIDGVTVGEAGPRGGEYAVAVTLTTIDPLKRISKLSVEYWFGEPGKNRPPADAQPGLEAGDTPRQVAAVAYDPEAARGRVELLLPNLPPAGKLLWVQPVYVNGAGAARWTAALAHEVQGPLAPRPATLAIRHKTGKSPLELQSRLTLRLNSTDGDNHSLVANIVTRLAEDTRSVDVTGTAAVRLTVDKFEIGLSLDGQAPPASPRLKRIVQDVGKVIIDRQIDSQGNVARGQVELQQVPVSSREVLANFADQVLQSLDMVTVPLPNGEVRVGQTWRATRMVPIEAFDAVQNGSLDMTYSYQGIRSRAGRDEAVVATKGTLRGIRGRSANLVGSATGTASIDLATGRVTRAQVVVTMTLDLFFRDETARATGKLEVNLTRGAADFAQANPPDKPAAGSLLGTWRLVRVEFNGQARPGDPKQPTLFVITPGTITIRDPGNLPVPWPYVLRPARPGAPLAMDVLITEDNPQGDTCPAIFAIEGDTLRLCINRVNNRLPTEFATEAKSGLTLYVLQRAADLLEKPPIVLKPDPPPAVPEDPFRNNPALVLQPDPPGKRPAVQEAAAPEGKVRQFAGQQSHTRQLFFTPDGKQAISIGGDGTVRLWEVETAKELRQHRPEPLAGRWGGPLVRWPPAVVGPQQRPDAAPVGRRCLEGNPPFRRACRRTSGRRLLPLLPLCPLRR